MAFGDVLATSGNNTAAITNPFSPSAAVTVAVGNLIVVNVAEKGSQTVTGVTDNLGNGVGGNYTALVDANQGSGGSGSKCFYAICTVAGSCTPAAACTASKDDAAITCVVYEGPFDASPLDKNPTHTEDGTSPYAGPATGTLAQADELIVGYWNNANGVTYSSPTPTGPPAARLDRQDASGTGSNTISSAISSLVVASTGTQTLGLTGSGSTAGAQGVATFKKGAAGPSTVTETETFTDAQSAKFAPAKKNYSETLTLTDTANRLFTTRATAAESLTIADTTNRIKVTKATSSESITLVDTSTAARIAKSTAAETLTLVDSQSVKANFKATAAESLSLVDTATAKRFTKSTASETLALTDTQTAKQTSRSTINESITLVDTASAVSGKLPSSITETITLTDAQTARQTSRSTASETLSLSDTQSAVKRTQLFLTETITLTDQQSATSAAAGSQVISESITLTDSQTARMLVKTSASETISLVDSQTTRFSKSRTTVTETISFIDRPDFIPASSGNICIPQINPPDGGLGISALAELPCLPIGVGQDESLNLIDRYDATVISGARDTHDGGFVKKRKKRKQADPFAEEIERRERIRKQITEVIHPPKPEEPEAIPVEIKPVPPLKPLDLPVTPVVDYAGLAKEEIIAKIKADALAKQFELSPEEAEEEEELEMILDAIL